ncbi:DUF6415 family natural product biosynthesis protein [Streptomyces nodosus]|uniref:DUF6415 family natural product biosynthesis protein n=1 Tax=Streptomyces nodosus TaxID=40318 RepID=UPI001185B611|nr:DUF6415 family natural product biosynthesis protein [Streptomyces nodosus]MBB4791887.1 hypothetical protein [Streptomyces nodosus]
MSGLAQAWTGTVRPDIETMRDTVGRLLPPRASAPADSELEMLTSLLCGHIEAIIPDVQAVVEGLPEDDVPGYCATVAIGKARPRGAAESHAGRERCVCAAFGPSAERPVFVLAAVLHLFKADAPKSGT